MVLLVATPLSPSPTTTAVERLLCCAAAVIALLSSSGRSRAEPGAPPPPVAPPEVEPDHRPEAVLAWDPRWPRFRPAEYAATALLTVGAFATLAIPPSDAPWTRINEFDASARDVLRIESPRERNAARDASDLMLGLMLSHLSIDPLLVTWWWQGRRDVAWEIATMDAEALALNAALNGLVVGLSSRERPYRDTCTGPEERQTYDCRNSKRYRSFFSGHTSTTFTTAGLTCSHHAHLPLYGGGAPDVLACVSSFTAAAAVGLLRVVSDQHFATDALTGAGVGTLIGLGVPWLLHYRGGATPAEDAARARREPGVSFRLMPAPTGGVITGSF